MKHAYLLILAALFLFSACTPLRVVRLEPFEEQVDGYLYGNAVATAKLGDVDVRTSFYDADDERVIFHVEVENKGATPIFYDPVGATLVSPDGTVEVAIDPEVELLTLDLDRIKSIRSNRTWAAIGAAATVATVVAATTTGGGVDTGDGFTTSTRQQLYTELAFTVLDASVIAAATNRLPLEPANLPAASERSFWLEYAMRVTTVKPGEVAIGKLVFPRTPVEGNFLLTTEVEGEVARFDYRQRVYR